MYIVFLIIKLFKLKRLCAVIILDCLFLHHPWSCLGGVWMWHWVMWFSGLSITVIVLGWWLDMIILQVSSKLYDSMIC